MNFIPGTLPNIKIGRKKIKPVISIKSGILILTVTEKRMKESTKIKIIHGKKIPESVRRIFLKITGIIMRVKKMMFLIFQEKKI